MQSVDHLLAILSSSLICTILTLVRFIRLLCMSNYILAFLILLNWLYYEIWITRSRGEEDNEYCSYKKRYIK
jgi:hypothetical protein